jgi:2-dehydropantoate 2-reductase
MNITIVGAGRIGSTFAFFLSRAGHRVTLVGRGQRLEDLRRDQAIIAVNGDRAEVQPAAALDTAKACDLVLVTVMAHQVDALLPELKACAARNVLFMFNTFEKTERLRGVVGAERFVSGFPNMMAFLVNGRLKSRVDGPGMVPTLSSPEWVEVFAKAGLPTELEPDMDSFLRTHVAFVVPLMAAANLTWQRSTELSWAEAKKLTLALREAIDLVRELGHTLKPGVIGVLVKLPRFFLTALVWAFARTDANKNLGEFGPGETRSLIDAMTAAAPAPGRTTRLLAIRP